MPAEAAAAEEARAAARAAEATAHKRRVELAEAFYTERAAKVGGPP